MRLSPSVSPTLRPVRVDLDVVLPARDGCKLLADIYGADPSEPRPVILERTPYGKSRTDQSEMAAGHSRPRSRHELAQAFVARGFVLVVQDCRGTGQSEGEFRKYLSEAEDGQDTLTWLAGQPWCNGRIGTMGFSYGAAAQLATASLGCANLAAMFLDCGGFHDAYRSGLRQGGAFDLKQATWALAQAKRMAASAGDDVLLAALEAQDLGDWLRRTPWRIGASPILGLPALEQDIVGFWLNEAFGPYWQRPGLYGRGALDRIAAVPTMLVSSWFDTSVLSTLDLAQDLHAVHGRAPPTIIGPWTHGMRCRTQAGELDFGPEAEPGHGLGSDPLAWRLDWFDQVLKVHAATAGQRPTGSQSRAPVRYFLMGGGGMDHSANGTRPHGGRWKSADRWPPRGALTRQLFLADGQGLQAEMPGAGLATLVADPARPVPTIGGAINSGQPVMAAGAFDQCATQETFAADGTFGPLQDRPDVLTFETAKLDAAWTVTGSVCVELHVATDGPDADIAVKLVDVYPDRSDGSPGPAYNITDGILRLSHRDPDQAPIATVPGNTYTVRVRMYPTANVFDAGHRIRLSIAGSNFPHFDINPNADPHHRSMDQARIATTTLFLGGTHPSRLLMDTVP